MLFSMTVNQIEQVMVDRDRWVYVSTLQNQGRFTGNYQSLINTNLGIGCIVKLWFSHAGKVL